MGALLCCFRPREDPDQEAIRSDDETVPIVEASISNSKITNHSLENFEDSNRVTVVDRWEVDERVGVKASPVEECPTCLEEYTPEQPKTTARCSHHYHLSCILEWMERSPNCPTCGKVMDFDEAK